MHSLFISLVSFASLFAIHLLLGYSALVRASRSYLFALLALTFKSLLESNPSKPKLLIGGLGVNYMLYYNTCVCYHYTNIYIYIFLFIYLFVSMKEVLTTFGTS